mmetsp:Transcript_16827/g.54337  ORF Transcript_16827/g.54337 Transcript_16827/m.54337 type:complete len:291 (+) Transcript_16827:2-874(+)
MYVRAHRSATMHDLCQLENVKTSNAARWLQHADHFRPPLQTATVHPTAGSAPQAPPTTRWPQKRRTSNGQGPTQCSHSGGDVLRRVLGRGTQPQAWCRSWWSSSAGPKGSICAARARGADLDAHTLRPSLQELCSRQQLPLALGGVGTCPTQVLHEGLGAAEKLEGHAARRGELPGLGMQALCTYPQGPPALHSTHLQICDRGISRCTRRGWCSGGEAIPRTREALVVDEALATCAKATDTCHRMLQRTDDGINPARFNSLHLQKTTASVTENAEGQCLIKDKQGAILFL